MSETRHTVHKRKMKKFGDLKPGTMFIAYYGNLYIKIQYGIPYDALCVEDGDMATFAEDEDVEPIARAEYYIGEEE